MERTEIAKMRAQAFGATCIVANSADAAVPSALGQTISSKIFECSFMDGSCLPELSLQE